MDITNILLKKAFRRPIRERELINGERAQNEGTMIPTLEPTEAFTPGATEAKSEISQGGATFASLSPQERKTYAGQLQNMHKKGQLWVEQEGKLKRATPAEIRQQLDGAESQANLVTLLSSEGSVSQTSRDSFKAQAGGLLFWTDASAERSASDTLSVEQTVNYVASPLTSWVDLEPGLNLPDDVGVMGTQFLPKSGGSVTRSMHWENQWLERSAQSSDIGGGWLGAGVGGKNDEGREVRTSRTQR